LLERGRGHSGLAAGTAPLAPPLATGLLRTDIAMPPEEDRATAKGELHNKFRKDPQGRRHSFEGGVQFLTPKPFAYLGTWNTSLHS